MRPDPRRRGASTGLGAFPPGRIPRRRARCRTAAASWRSKMAATRRTRNWRRLTTGITSCYSKPPSGRRTSPKHPWNSATRTVSRTGPSTARASSCSALRASCMSGRHGDGWQAFNAKGELTASGYGRQGDKQHQDNFIACVRSRNKPNADVESGHHSTMLCHLANIAWRVGEPRPVLRPANGNLSRRAGGEPAIETPPIARLGWCRIKCNNPELRSGSGGLAAADWRSGPCASSAVLQFNTAFVGAKP